MLEDQPDNIRFSIGAAQGDAGDFSFLQDDQLHTAEGQLAVDVMQTEENLVVVAAMAGTAPEHIQLHLHNDLLTIRGQRSSPIKSSGQYFYQECYWGKFSRSIILPAEVRAELAQATYAHGVLTVILPKSKNQNAIPIMVIEE
jgi:HSP20 family protein